MKFVSKKIQNVTLYWENVRYNFGNTLQAYAMHAVLNKIGRSKLICLRTYSVKRNIIRYLKKIKYSALKMDVLKRRKDHLYENFYRHIKVKKKKYGFEYDKGTYYVCGSDQIWNPFYGGKPELFAYGAETKYRIAYAASFGVSTLDDDVKERYSRYLDGMEYISVREERAAELVYELTGKKVPVVLDPTLLLTAEEWKKVSKQPKFCTGKFILTYFLGNLEKEYTEYISALAEKLGCRVIHLEELNGGEHWYSTGPAEFLWLIEHCEFMCTDSFHGSVFSVIMKKPFLVFERIDGEAPMNSRLDTLLSKLKLEDRRYIGQPMESVLNIDYGDTHKIIENEKKKAFDFLKNALEAKS